VPAGGGITCYEDKESDEGEGAHRFLSSDTEPPNDPISSSVFGSQTFGRRSKFVAIVGRLGPQSGNDASAVWTGLSTVVQIRKRAG
jgi:hypothetical protein